MADEPTVALARLIAAARRLVVFTGAGVSTESGIPDFRSPGGLWDRYRPITYQEFLSDPAARAEAWRRGLETYRVVAAAQPNPAHLAIVELERLGKLDCLITQNVDGLHQRAGSSRVVELHGNSHRVRCLDCAAEFERMAVHARVEAGEATPDCSFCGGVLKSATVSFGEPLPAEAFWTAERHTRTCDAFLVVGSSLVVHPAASLPALAVRSGARLAIVNVGETPLDPLAEVLVREPAGRALPQAVELVRTMDAGR